MKLQKYFLLNIHQTDLVFPTHQMFCLLCGLQIDLIYQIPPNKGKTVRTNTFIWVYLLQMNRQMITMKTSPKGFNNVNKLWQWKDTILPMIYFIKYSCGGFGKILIRKFIYVIFHIFYHSLFSFLALGWQGNITSHSPNPLPILLVNALAAR